jgi:hypothetical protein
MEFVGLNAPNIFASRWELRLLLGPDRDDVPEVVEKSLARAKPAQSQLQSGSSAYPGPLPPLCENSPLLLICSASASATTARPKAAPHH